MYGIMARFTDGKAIVNIKPKCRISGERFNMVSNKNFTFSVATLLANKMVSLKHLASPFFHLEGISGPLVLRTNTTLPTGIVFPSQGVNFCAIADMQSLFIRQSFTKSIFLTFVRLGDKPLSFIGEMFTFNPRGHSLMSFANCILNRLRSRLPEISIAFTGYACGDFTLSFFSVVLAIKRIRRPLIHRTPFKRLAQSIAPHFSFGRVSWCGHTYSIVNP